MALSATPELWFLPFAIVIGGWIAYSDLAQMKILNKAVLALLAVFFFVGLLALPLEIWAWRWAHFGVAIVITYLLATVGMMGAGDAKFLAASMPFVALPQFPLYALVLSVLSILGFIGHRVFRRTAWAKNRFGHWASLDDKRFPMGLALGPALALYLAIVAFGA